MLATVSLLHRLASQSKPVNFCLALITIPLLSLVDYLTGYEISFSFFYIMPIAFAAWFINTQAAILIAATCSVALTVINYLAGENLSHPLIYIWNCLISFSFFILVVSILIKLKNTLERERILSRYDTLTEIFNRRAFYEITSQEILRTNRHHNPFTICYIDIDNFKIVNDRLGHAAGDNLLSFLVKKIQGMIREVDTIGRLGGDEFAILLPETDFDKAEAVINKLQTQLAAEIQQEEYPISLSIGCITCTNTTESVDALINEADRLMYEVKRSGKNGIKHIKH